MTGGVYAMLMANVGRRSPTSGGRSTELALPRCPDGIKAFALAGRELAELIIRLLGKFEGVAGNGQDVFVIEDGEEVPRVDASTWDVGYEEGATAVIRRHEGVHVEELLTLVVWSRRLDAHDPALDKSNCNGTVAQHG